MKILLFVSEAIIPLLVFYIVVSALLAKKNVYDDFIKGAKDGFKTVVGILPTLIGLMVAVGILRASGIFDLLAKAGGSFFEAIHFPAELLPVTIVKMFSSSAATGLLVDIFKEFGTDSRNGLIASLILSSTDNSVI